MAPGLAGHPPTTPLALSPPVRTVFPKRRLLMAAGLAAGVLAAYALYRAGAIMTAWLGDQPGYQVPFGSIVLEPPPPDWYRGGREAFLEDVRRRARMSDTFSVLKLRLDELKYIFQRSPWTEAVDRVEYPPGGAIVRLRYREPVAVVATYDRESFLVDGSAVILPAEDLDCDLQTFEKQQHLIRIQGAGLAGPAQSTPGLAWKVKPGVNDIARGNDKIDSATGLAGFLRRKMGAADASHPPPINVTHINPMDLSGRGLFVWIDGTICVFWGNYPDKDAPGVLSDDEKWEKLTEWHRTDRLKELPPKHFWEITAGGLVHLIGSPARQSARNDQPARDASAIRVNGSGQ
jgi:hypothetical protein